MMNAEPLMIAIDIGTSGARAVVFDHHGKEQAHQRSPYAAQYPRAGWAEQDPDVIVQAVIAVLRAAIAALPDRTAVSGVVFSAQLYSILALDSAGRPLTRSLTWGDMRAAQEAEELRTQASHLSAITGCPLQALYPLAKIVWLQRHADLPATARFVSIKDYVLYQLTGHLLTDWTTASATGLLDVARLHWHDEALTVAGLTHDRLPPLVSPRHIIRGWRAAVRSAAGLDESIPIIVGAGDAPLANIGVGATRPGTIAINLGTSAAARAFSLQPRFDPDGRLWTYAADSDRWVVGGMIGSGGAAYEWLLTDIVSGAADFSAAEALAHDAPPGADGLLFIPYVSGEQSPGWNPHATGTLHGLRLHHGRAHLVRAAIEGIVFALLRTMQPIAAVTERAIERIYLTGGLSMSHLWRQTIANAAGIPIVVPHGAESSARGAAILGLLALGLAPDYAAFDRPDVLLQPDPVIHDLYQERFDAFCSINSRLRSLDEA